MRRQGLNKHILLQWNSICFICECWDLTCWHVLHHGWGHVDDFDTFRSLSVLADLSEDEFFVRLDSFSQLYSTIVMNVLADVLPASALEALGEGA